MRALCSLLCIYLPIYNQSPLHWPTGVQPPQMQLQQLKLLTNTTRRDSKQRCNYVLSIGFLLFFLATNVCGTHVLHLLCLLFVLANLPWAVHVPVCGMTFPLLWLCAQWQNRELTRICFWVRVLSIITEINIVCGVFELLATLLLTCGSRLSFKYWLFQLGGSLQQVLSYQQGVGKRLIICVSRQHFMRVYERG